MLSPKSVTIFISIYYHNKRPTAVSQFADPKEVSLKVRVLDANHTLIGAIVYLLALQL